MRDEEGRNYLPVEPTVDYGKIAKAISYYCANHYKYIEVPWLVSHGSLDVTKPPGARYFDTFAGSLVASGEQSFLEIRDDLEPNKGYVCATPCFRDEKYDDIHMMHFFKVELIVPRPKNAEWSLFEMIELAESFFRKFYCGGFITRVPTDIGIDINIGNIEVGSYGIREHKGFKWVYGTGCAEPRLSQAIQML